MTIKNTGRSVASMLLLTVAIVFSSGCQSTRNAVINLGEDLTDIVVVDATFSCGTDMGGHVMFSELIQAKAYSYENLYRAGLGTRQAGLWKCEREQWAISLANSPNINMKQEAVLTLSPLQAVTGKSTSKNGIKALYIESIDEVGIGGHLFFVGGRLGIRPLEIIDLFANLLTVDLLRDNMEWHQRQALWAAKNVVNNAVKENIKYQKPSL